MTRIRASASVLASLLLVLLLPGRTGLVATGLVAASLVLAQIWFFHYSRVFELERITWLVAARDAALVALYVLLLVRLKTSTPSSEKTSSHSRLRRSRARSLAAADGSQRSA